MEELLSPFILLVLVCLVFKWAWKIIEGVPILGGLGRLIRKGFFNLFQSIKRGLDHLRQKTWQGVIRGHNPVWVKVLSGIAWGVLGVTSILLVTLLELFRGK